MIISYKAPVSGHRFDSRTRPLPSGDLQPPVASPFHSDTVLPKRDAFPLQPGTKPMSKIFAVAAGKEINTPRAVSLFIRPGEKDKQI
jgi:hypothetical protein